MNAEPSGTNYRLNLWLKPDCDLNALYEAISQYCAEPDSSQEYQPSITITARVDDQILAKASNTPGVTGTPHYIPANSHEKRPIPRESFMRATAMLTEELQEQCPELGWRTIEHHQIDHDTLHNLYRMMAAEWIHEHVAYPNNPTIEIPNFPEHSFEEYLARWDIRIQEISTIDQPSAD